MNFFPQKALNTLGCKEFEVFIYIYMWEKTCIGFSVVV